MQSLTILLVDNLADIPMMLLAAASDGCLAISSMKLLDPDLAMVPRWSIISALVIPTPVSYNKQTTAMLAVLYRKKHFTE